MNNIATIICLVIAVFSTAKAQVQSSVIVSVQQESYTFSEDDSGAEVCVVVQDGFVLSGQTFTVGYGSFGGTATAFEDYNLPDGSLSLNDANQFQLLCVSIPIINDNTPETEECFTIFFFDMDNDPNFDVIEPQQATVCITDDDSSSTITPAAIGFNDISISTTEGSFATVCAQVIGGQQLDRNIVFTMTSADGSAVSGQDYIPLNAELSFNPANDQQLLCMNLNTIDDGIVEGLEDVFVDITTSSPQVTISPSRATITIVDNDVADPCNPSPCDTNAMCTSAGGVVTCTCNSGYVGDGFTCMQMGGGDDPHFSIVLPSGKLLCFTVQGEHGFAFNLICNEHLHMNALFMPDSQRKEVTWMGSLGITVHYATNSYQGNNKTSLRFDAKDETVHIGDKVTLDARAIHSLDFKNNKMYITEATSEQKETYPSVTVCMEDVGLHFTIMFVGEHLDIYWNDVAAQAPESSGLIGQFFRKGVDIDETRKILIMPNKEPVPVMRRPVWSFMERETTDDQLCWTAMNSGYQGEGLIDGTYFDYLVDDVMSTDFKSPQHNAFQ